MDEISKIGTSCPPGLPGSPPVLDIGEYIDSSPSWVRAINTSWEDWNSTVRVYSNGHTMIRFFRSQSGLPKRSLDSPSPSSEEAKLQASVSRARNAIFDLAFGNPWDYFITLTFDQKKVGDRYDYDNIKSCMKTFTQFLYRHDCQWLLVPELHKDGAYHYHGMVRGYLDSTYRETKFNKLGEEYDCYSIDGYHLGRSDISPITDPDRISTYITKYVTKDCLSVVPPGAKKYWASRGLSRPKKTRAYFGCNEVSSLVSRGAYVRTAVDPLGNSIVTVIL